VVIATVHTHGHCEDPKDPKQSRELITAPQQAAT
jgi:hypothetical protein